jgi:hypothetical protein
MTNDPTAITRGDMLWLTKLLREWNQFATADAIDSMLSHSRPEPAPLWSDWLEHDGGERKAEPALPREWEIVGECLHGPNREGKLMRLVASAHDYPLPELRQAILAWLDHEERRRG